MNLRFAWLPCFIALTPIAALAGGRHQPNGTPAQYTVTATADGNGTADPASQLIDQGNTANFTITPDTGYALGGVDGGACGVHDNGDGTWTSDQIFADCGITAYFVLDAADVMLKGDFDPDIVEADAIDLQVDQSILGSSINWLTGATCHSCPEPVYQFRAASSFPIIGNIYLVFRFPMNLPDDAYGVVTDITGDEAASVPLYSGDAVGPDRTFAYPVSTNGAAAWRTSNGVDAYLGFRFFDTNTGRIDYGYARLMTGAGTSGFPATIVGYAYDQRGNPITIP